VTPEQLPDFLRKQVRAPVEKNAGAMVKALGGDPKAIEVFQLGRVLLDEVISRIEEQELRDLDARLARLSGSLSEGTRQMKQALGKVKDFAQAAELFTTVVAIAARIAALA
jgi:hypothetical protein